MSRYVLNKIKPLLQKQKWGGSCVRYISLDFEIEHKKNYIEISEFQRALLSVGSAIISLSDPFRADMIACLGETTGGDALIRMREKMEGSKEGREILKDKPRINSATVDLKKLSQLPEGTIGKVYTDFLQSNNVTPDSRLPVQFIKDVELAYVMQRYREVHDLIHAVLNMKTNMVGEVTIKWIEALQTDLPMCRGGALFGALRLKPKHYKLYMDNYLPWALKTGREGKFFQSVYFEKRWEQPLSEFYKEMNITEFKIVKM